MISTITVLVGPPGCGKSTLREKLMLDHDYYVNQDEHGKECFKTIYLPTIFEGKNSVVIDRMNFNKEQRERYLKPAKEKGYNTKIIVLHESRETCIKRGLNRLQNDTHPTIKTEEDLHRAVNFFFSHYERPTEDEADTIIFHYPEHKLSLNEAIICDIDGTMANLDHRQYFVKNGSKDWKNFLHPENVKRDRVNEWCKTIVNELHEKHNIIMCSGRPDSLRATTEEWLKTNNIHYDELFMRPRDDHRKDNIVKEILLDFEILTRVKPIFAIDDRQQVIKMLRNRGITTLDCSGEDF